MPEKQSFWSTTGGSLLSGGLGSFVNSALGGLGSLLSGSYGKAKRMQSRQYEFQRQLNDQMAEINETAAENAYARQVDFWNQQNAYNSPENQRKLREDAGLSPFALNGNLQGAGVSSGLSSTPAGISSSGGSVGGSFTPAPISAASGLSLLPEQKSLLRAQADKTAAEANRVRYDQDVVQPALLSLKASEKALNDANVRNVDIATALNNLKFSFEQETYDLNVESAYLRREMLDKDIQRLTVGIQNSLSELSRQDDVSRLLKVNIEKAVNESIFLKVKTELARHEVNLTDAEIREVIARAKTEGSRNALIRNQAVGAALENQLLDMNIEWFTADHVFDYINTSSKAAISLALLARGARSKARPIGF